MQSFHRVTATIVCSLLLFGCSNPEPVSHTTEDGRMTVVFPGPVKSETQSVDTPIGKIDLKMVSCETKRAFLAINQVTYPVDPADYDVEAGLEGAVKEAAARVKGTITSKKTITHNGLPGREVIIDVPGGMTNKSVYFIDGSGPTLFQAQAVVKGDIDQSVVKHFFESLRIKPAS